MDFKEELLCAMKCNADELSIYGDEIVLVKDRTWIKAKRLPVFKDKVSYEKGWFGKEKKIVKSVHIGFNYTITCNQYSYNITKEDYDSLKKDHREAQEQALKEKLNKFCNKN